MAIITAKYKGTCPGCGKQIRRGDRIVFDPKNGVLATHVNCAPKPEDVRKAEAAIERGRRMTEWERRNPKPEPEEGPGAPMLDLEDAFTDEERRCAKGRHEDAMKRWLAQNAEIEAAYTQKLAEWTARRDAFERRLSESGSSNAGTARRVGR